MNSNRTNRPLLIGKSGAVASNHPVATQAGLDVLREGGNAVDAAVAMSLVMGVVEPYMSGLGGDGFYQTFDASDGSGMVFNGAGPAPASWGNGPQSSLPSTGPLASSVPGSLSAVWCMHAAKGSLPWARLVEPAIHAAADGFGATYTFIRFTKANEEKVASSLQTSKTFLPSGHPVQLGTWIRQTALANTLRAVSEEGAPTFYRGALATLLCEDFQEMGFAITAADLAGFSAEVQQPISINYRGFEVRQTPPNSTGFTFLQALKIVEQFDVSTMSWLSADLTHILVEAKKLAFLDRERYGGDPHRFPPPLDRLLSREHAAELAQLIDLSVAATRPVREPTKSADTTYFCAVDKGGNAVSAIQSLNNAFGSGVTLPRTGVLMNNRMNCWHTEAGHPNRLEGGVRVRHTMNAPLVLRNGKVWSVFGTPGADDQVQVNLQMAVGMMDLGWDPQSLVESPRWNSSQPGQHANWPHGGVEELTVEANFPKAELDVLQTKGHQMKVVPELQGPCSVSCIRALEDGTLLAASDPRRDGWAAAF